MKDKEPFFFDTNILIYSVYGTVAEQAKIKALVTNQKTTLHVSTQVLKEFVNASVKKKFHKTTSELKQHLAKINESFVVADVNLKTILLALDLKDEYRYSFYDSLIIATALESSCATLYSEDLQHGQIVRKKLRIVNPFK